LYLFGKSILGDGAQAQQASGSESTRTNMSYDEITEILLCTNSNNKCEKNKQLKVQRFNQPTW